MARFGKLMGPDTTQDIKTGPVYLVKPHPHGLNLIFEELFLYINFEMIKIN